MKNLKSWRWWVSSIIGGTTAWIGLLIVGARVESPLTWLAAFIIIVGMSIADAIYRAGR